MGRMLHEIDLYKAYTNWNKNSGSFRYFFRSTNFVSLKHYTDFELTETTNEVENPLTGLLDCIEGCDKKSMLFVLDLPDAEAVEGAYLLYKQRAIQPILTFNGILHPNGLIGTKEYISTLLNYADSFEDYSPEGYCFILDSNRYGDYSPEQLRHNFNNQYEIGEEDLPPVEMLKELGFSSLIYIYKTEIKEDVAYYLKYLKENGFAVDTKKFE